MAAPVRPNDLARQLEDLDIVLGAGNDMNDGDLADTRAALRDDRREECYEVNSK